MFGTYVHLRGIAGVGIGEHAGHGLSTAQIPQNPVEPEAILHERSAECEAVVVQIDQLPGNAQPLRFQLVAVVVPLQRTVRKGLDE